MKTQNQSDLIRDDQRLIGATSRFGHEISIYDDGYGALYVHRNSLGISGIVRARTWEDAYSICEDEFFPEASETVQELRAEYNFTRKDVKIVRDPSAAGGERIEQPSDYVDGRLPDGLFVRWQTIETPAEDENAWAENELFCEAFGFRPNGARSGNWPNGNPRDPIGHGIYAKDLNGDALDLLTPDLLARLEITLRIEAE